MSTTFPLERNLNLHRLDVTADCRTLSLLEVTRAEFYRCEKELLNVK